MIDLLLVLAVIAVVAALLATAGVILRNAKTKAIRIGCINNLKQCELSFVVWSGDNNGKFPMEVSTNSGGTRELVPQGQAFQHFQVMSNELSTPVVLWCPKDTRLHATNFTTDFGNPKISFFVGADASLTNSQAWLCGDRNITNGLSPDHNTLTLDPGRPAGWTEKLHNGRGNVSDSSFAKQLANGDLRDLLKNASGWTNRIILPE